MPSCLCTDLLSWWPFDEASGTPEDVVSGRDLTAYAVGPSRSITVLGRPLRVAASVHTLGGFSAHADQQRLMTWAGKFRAAKPRTFPLR